MKRWVTGTAIAVGLVLAGVGAFVVVRSVGRATSSAVAGVVAEPTPAPELSAVLHANYRVLSTTSLSLTGEPAPETVVVSAGPGLDPANPVVGGTQTVQVLAYDKVARRWNVVFDAASNVLPADYSQAEPTTRPLFDQAHTITDVVVTPVRMTKDSRSQLVIFGVDGYTNHPVGMTAIVTFDSPTPQLAWSDSITNAAAPVVSGKPGAQVLSLTAGWVTGADPACCPLRQFTRQVGAKADGMIGVVSDDRPWLGAWIAPTSTSASSRDGIVVATVANSPADPILKIGDRVVGVVGAAKPANTVLDVDVVDQIALAHPGDKVVLSVRRDGRMIELPVTLGSYADATAQGSTAPVAGYLGVQMVSSPAGAPPGAIVVRVTPGGPAQRAGLTSGQLIQAVGDVTATDPDAVSAALFGQAGRTVALAVTTPLPGWSAGTIEGLGHALAGGQNLSLPITIATYPPDVTPTMSPLAL